MITRRGLLSGVLGLLGLGVLAAVGAVVLPGRYLSTEIMVTVFTTGIYAMGVLLVLALPARMPRTRAACLVLAGVSYAVFLATVLLDRWSVGWRTISFLHEIAGSALLVSLALLQRLVLIPLPIRAAGGRVARRAGLIAGMLGASFSCAYLLFEPHGIVPGELAERLLLVSVIVAVGGSIGAGVVWFGERRPEHADPGLLGEGVAVRLDCPRCGGPIEARSNREARCGGCRLKVRVEVDEPRCVCGYLLYELVGAVCPECGEEVPEADRWAAPA